MKPSWSVMSDDCDKFTVADLMWANCSVNILCPLANANPVLRIVYDISELTQLLSIRQCRLPLFGQTLKTLTVGLIFANKIDLMNFSHFLASFCCGHDSETSAFLALNLVHSEM